MPLYVSNIRQQAYGVVDSAASAVVGFDTSLGFQACDAGNTVVLIVTAGRPWTTPGAFTSDQEVITAASPTPTQRWLRLPVTSGGETTWTINESTATATAWSWRAVEFVGLAQAVSPAAQFSQHAQNGLEGGNTLNLARTSGETGSATRLDVVQLAAACYWSPMSAAKSAACTWYVGPLTKLGDYSTLNASGYNLSTGFWEYYSENVITRVGITFGPTVSAPGFTIGIDGADEFFGGWVTYAAADSPVLDPIVMGTGFEFGTHHGITGGPTAAPGPAQIADAVGGTHGTGYQVTTTAPKNGTYHLRITAAATAPFVRWTTNTIGTGVTQTVFGGYLKCVSATSNPAVLAEFTPATGTNVQIVYNVTTTKIGVRRGAGTVAYQSGTTALGSYAWVDLLTVWNSATQPTSWRCEQAGVVVAQTGPANLAGQTSTTWATAVLGSATSQTMTADYDDICLASEAVDYPLGRHKVVLLVPDTAVAATLANAAGTTWSAITNNAVGSNLTTTGAANVPGRLDEVPPNFSATADGIAAVTAASTDYVEIAMTSYTAAATERIDSARFYLCGWAASSSTASLQVDYQHTGSLTAFIASTAHGTFINTTTGSATVPGWYAKTIPAAGGWSQASLDALKFRLSSVDVNPDIGVQAMYVEVAVFIDFVGAPTRSDVPPLHRHRRHIGLIMR